MLTLPLPSIPSETYSGYEVDLGLKYRSTTLNTISVVLMLCFVLFVHLCIVIPLYLKSRNRPPENKLRRCSEGVLGLLTLNAYVQLFLEVYTILSLSVLLQLFNGGYVEGMVVLVLLVGGSLGVG